ncbi:hypothetical protein M441DRAFT_303948 [Trichoderma asperellum CBS 433.97]|uniref:Uncharacterized protein n=1 Tax=Trichoderma asperellum (strain ATCC 204424 / CBS 433.97 / NBRC 101777) TaxID=1042311 RepID=A0A2T3ZJN3_TRIA4|nr:hypothetical protein M441DRAFT_303948 [Trichoderma asperellum CBS 433.97]PTB45021.1 hypothetical protein M441DRAFT_303948 [Trichoderma asperellum CBS 433.97]
MDVRISYSICFGYACRCHRIDNLRVQSRGIRLEKTRDAKKERKKERMKQRIEGRSQTATTRRSQCRQHRCTGRNENRCRHVTVE